MFIYLTFLRFKKCVNLQSSGLRLSLFVQMALCDRDVSPPLHLFAEIINTCNSRSLGCEQSPCFACLCYMQFSLFTCMLISHLFFSNTGALQSASMNMHWVKDFFFLFLPFVKLHKLFCWTCKLCMTVICVYVSLSDIVFTGEWSLFLL